MRADELDPPLRASRYIRAGDLIRRLRDTYKDLTAQEREVVAPYLYDEACTYALEGKPEKAMDTLADAVDSGLDVPEMVATDGDLDSIRKLPRFADLLKKLEQNARAQATRAAKRILAEAAPFAFHFELPSIQGKTVNLDDLKGNVVLVDFWGTWCPPCRKELPHFQQLLAKHRDQGLTIVGINYERAAESDVKDTIRQFVAEHDGPLHLPDRRPGDPQPGPRLRRLPDPPFPRSFAEGPGQGGRLPYLDRARGDGRAAAERGSEVELTARGSFSKVRPSTQAVTVRRSGGSHDLDRELVLDGAPAGYLGILAVPCHGDVNLGPADLPDPEPVRAVPEVLHTAVGNVAILGDVCPGPDP